MQRLWLVLGDCGDYYCEGQHPIGVYSTEELANQAVEKAKKQKIRYHKGNLCTRYESAYTKEVRVDKMPVATVDAKDFDR